MRKFLKFIALGLAICSVFPLVACGGGGRNNGAMEDESAWVIDWDSFDWEGERDSKSTITVCLPREFQDVYETEISGLEAMHSEYSVEPIWTGSGSSLKQYQAQLMGGRDCPDLIVGGDVHILYQKEELLPLNKLIERDAAEVMPEDYLDGFLDALSYGVGENRGIYYLPEYFNVSLLYYNIDMFDDAGLSYPTAEWTYDDFFAAGKTLTTRDNSGYLTWGTETVFDWWTQWLTFVRQSGGVVMNEDGYVELNTEAALKGLQYYFDMAGAAQQPDTWGNKIGPTIGENNLGQFQGGKVGMIFAGHTGAFATYRSATETFGLNWDIQLLPTTNEGNRNGGELSLYAYGIYRNSQNKKGAWEFLKYLSRQKSKEELLSATYISPRKSAEQIIRSLTAEEKEELLPQSLSIVYDAVKYSEYLPRFSYFESVMDDRVQPALLDMFEGSRTVQEAGEAATSIANNYIRNTYMR